MKNVAIAVLYPDQNCIDNVSVIDQDLERVVKRLLSEDYSPNSRRAIQTDLKSFIGWYMQKNGETFKIRRVTERDVRDYRDEASKGGHAVATVNRRLTTLKRLFAVAVEESVIPSEKNPTLKVKMLAVQQLAPKGLTQQMTRSFLREVDIRGNVRDRAMIELMLGAGLRVSEVVHLTLADIAISERKGTVVIRHSKGNKTRTVPLSLNVRTALGDYLQAAKPIDRVFVGQRGALTAIAVNKIVGKYGEKAKVSLSPHTLRHTFAFNYLRSNPGDIVGLSQILGHGNINTTAIYTQNRLEDLAEKVDAIGY